MKHLARSKHRRAVTRCSSQDSYDFARRTTARCFCGPRSLFAGGTEPGQKHRRPYTPSGQPAQGPPGFFSADRFVFFAGGTPRGFAGGGLRLAMFLTRSANLAAPGPGWVKNIVAPSDVLQGASDEKLFQPSFSNPRPAGPKTPKKNPSCSTSALDTHRR